MRFSDLPDVYNRFINIMKDYERSACSKWEVEVHLVAAHAAEDASSEGARE